MEKDYLKIYDALDRKDLREEKKRTQAMQEAGVYPKSLNFPLTLQFELTTRCNVFCKHCYNDSGEKNNARDPMTPEKWIEFSRYLVEHGGIFECILSGGEPLLLGDKLFDIMDILHDDGTSFLLITNGYLLSREKVERLAKYRYHWLQVSIDGVTPEYHDAFRRKEGSWQRAVDGAFQVSAAGIPLTIAHSVTPGNLEQVDAMCELAYELGASSIILGEVNISGRSAANREIFLNNSEKAILLKKFEENYARYQGKMLVRRSGSTKTSVLRYLNSPNAGLIIRPNGDMRLDCMAPFVIGNVLRDDFAAVWTEKHDSCWRHPSVSAYIESFQKDDSNSMLTNYVDSDVYI